MYHLRVIERMPSIVIAIEEGPEFDGYRKLLLDCADFLVGDRVGYLVEAIFFEDMVLIPRSIGVINSSERTYS